MRTTLSILAVIIVTFILYSCTANKRTAFVYPDGVGTESSWVQKDGFSNFESCKEFALQLDNGSSAFDYECGYKCEYKASMGVSVCKKSKD